MQITDKDLQQFRERAKTELQSNGAVGRLAWDAVVNALCDEVEELRKNVAISNAVDSAWVGVCAACAEGTPPARCAYYGDPNGCNAPTLGKHPEGNLAERLQEALEKAERRIAELERASGNVAAMRSVLTFADSIDVSPEVLEETEDWESDVASFVDDLQERAKAALAAPARNCDRFADELDAQLAFLNDVWLISVDKNTMIEKDKFENWTEQMKTRYGRWLLAPAEGKEASNG